MASNIRPRGKLTKGGGFLTREVTSNFRVIKGEIPFTGSCDREAVLNRKGEKLCQSHTFLMEFKQHQT